MLGAPFDGQAFIIGMAEASIEGERAYIEKYRDALLAGAPEQIFRPREPVGHEVHAVAL